jgi:hypothetical protein
VEQKQELPLFEVVAEQGASILLLRPVVGRVQVPISALVVRDFPEAVAALPSEDPYQRCATGRSR